MKACRGDGWQDVQVSVSPVLVLYIANLTDELFEIFEELFFWCVVFDQCDDHFDDSDKLSICHFVLHLLTPFLPFPCYNYNISHIDKYVNRNFQKCKILFNHLL